MNLVLRVAHMFSKLLSQTIFSSYLALLAECSTNCDPRLQAFAPQLGRIFTKNVATNIDAHENALTKTANFLLPTSFNFGLVADGRDDQERGDKTGDLDRQHANARQTSLRSARSWRDGERRLVQRPRDSHASSVSGGIRSIADDERFLASVRLAPSTRRLCAKCVAC